MDEYPALSRLAGRAPLEEALVRQISLEIGKTADPTQRKLLASYFDVLRLGDRAASEAAEAIRQLLGLSREPEHLPNAYSPRTLAKRWLCSERHVRNMIKRGVLPYNKLGGKLFRMRREDVEEYERRNAVKPQ